MNAWASCLVRTVAFLIATLVAGPASRAAPSSDTVVYVIVSAQSSVQSLSQKEVVALYTGRSLTFPNGETAIPFDMAREGTARASFYQLLTGMDIARINSYWARLHFTAQVKPPKAMSDEKMMLDQVRGDAQAIGYMLHEPRDASVRVVLRLP